MEEFTPLRIDNQSVEAIIGGFSGSDVSPETALAKGISDQLAADDPELLYDKLKTGNSSYLQGLGPLTDEEIILTLARNMDGSEITTGKIPQFFSGFGRGVAPAVASIPAAAKGFELGMAAQAVFPPAPYFLPVKLGIPIVTTLAGGIFGNEVIEFAQDLILGEEGVALPDDRAAREAGRTVADTLAVLSGARVVGKKFTDNVNLGGAQFLKNLEAQKKALYRFEQLLEAGKTAPRGKLSGGDLFFRQPAKVNPAARLNQAVETLLGQAPKDPLKYKTELITALGAGTGAYFAEDFAPGSFIPRLVAEVGGGSSAGFLPNLIETVVANKDKFKNLFSVLTERFSPEKRRFVTMQQIIQDLEASDDPLDDVNTIMTLLADPSFKKMLSEEKLGDVRSVVLRTGSPVLAAHERAVDAANSGGLAQRRSIAAEELLDSYRASITALARSGDSNAIQLAADMMYADFKSALQARIQFSIDETLRAYDQLGKLSRGNNVELSAALFSNMENLLKTARAEENKLWKSVQDSELTMEQVADAGGYPRTEEGVDIVDDFLADFENLEPGIADERKKKLGNLIKFVKSLRDRISPVSPDPNEYLSQASEPIRQSLARLRKAGYKPEVEADGQLGMKDFEGGTGLDRYTIPRSMQERIKNLQKNDPEAVYIEFDETGKPNLEIHDAFDDIQRDAGMGETGIASSAKAAFKLQQDIARLKPETAKADDLVNDYNAVQGYLDQFDPTPSVDPEATISSKGLFDARSTALETMRTLAAQPGGGNKAFKAGQVADLILDLLDELPFEGRADYEIARRYSRALNDAFTRTFIGKTKGKKKTGEKVIAPELYFKQLFQGGADPTYVKLKSLDDVEVFMRQQGLSALFTDPDTGQTTDLLGGSQDLIQRMLANVFAAEYNPQTQQVNRTGLAKKMRDYSLILDRFPDIREALLDSDKAVVLLENANAIKKNFEERSKKQVGFRNLLSENTESPATAVADALAGSGKKKPIESLNNLLLVAQNEKLTEEQQQQAIEGLRYAILDWATESSGAFSVRKDGHSNFRPSQMYNALFMEIPNAKNKESLLKATTKDGKVTFGGWMIENGVIEEEMAERLLYGLGELMKAERAVDTGFIQDLGEPASQLMDLYLTMVGSAGATTAAAKMGLRGGTGNIAIPARGAEMARDFYNKMPQRMRINVLQDMFEDPDLFLEMMKKVKTQEEKQARIPALLEVIKAATGIRIPDLTRRFISSDPTGTLEEYPEDPEPDLPQLQGAATPPTMSPPPAAPSPAFGPVDRSQYAALFPSDIASGLIRQQQRPERQGIGSLV